MAARRRILIAEDEAAIRSAVAEYLQSEGFDVVEVANGVEALEAARQTPVDLLLVDLAMPVMSGAELVQTWIGDESLCSIPVILISAAPGLTTAAREFGVRATLAKPFDLDVLAAVVDQVLAHPEPPPDSETVAGE